jgi:hypothetical protein
MWVAMPGQSVESGAVWGETSFGVQWRMERGRSRKPSQARLFPGWAAVLLPRRRLAYHSPRGLQRPPDKNTRIQDYTYSTRLVRTVTASLLPFSRSRLGFDFTASEKEASTAHGLTRSWSWAAVSSRPCQQRMCLADSNPSLRLPKLASRQLFCTRSASILADIQNRAWNLRPLQVTSEMPGKSPRLTSDFTRMPCLPA